MCNGVIQKNGTRLLVKGVAKKEEVKTVEHKGKTRTETVTDVIKIGIKALNLDSGGLLNIE